jgi:hypothetical protein
VIGKDQADEIEPVLGQLGQDLALVRDERGQDPVEGGDPVRGDDQQLVADRVDVADLPFLKRVKPASSRSPIGRSIIISF